MISRKIELFQGFRGEIRDAKGHQWMTFRGTTGYSMFVDQSQGTFECKAIPEHDVELFSLPAINGNHVQCPCCRTVWKAEGANFFTNITGIEVPGIYDGILYYQCNRCQSQFAREGIASRWSSPTVNGNL